MRQNLPITTKERTFSVHAKLISVTNTQGFITECNDAFVEISGFTKEQLIGQPHNIVRHPDMPPEAFAVMWQHIQAGKPWMGLVKNRCKNGDFYWVDAYVTPVTEQGKIIGYESVRQCPKREDVVRAERLYQKINQGQYQEQRFGVAAEWIILLLALLPAGLAVLMDWLMLGVSWLVLSFCLGLAWLSLHRQKTLQALQTLLQGSFTHPLAVQSYTDSTDELGALQVAVMSQSAHLSTVISRIENAAFNVSRESLHGAELTKKTQKSIERQQSETFQVATAMNEMTTTIAEVSNHVSETASQADTAQLLATQGNHVAEVTRLSIEQLRQTVADISTSVAEVAEQTSKIAHAAQMIEQIADQTNLLALNAAIEAARAGEQGRGFAVVADEVRNLAKRTQESTREIYSIVKELTSRAANAVETAGQGTQAADEGLEKVVESGKMLNGITNAVAQIASMSTQMAAAVEQQSHVAEDINQQLVSISELADHSAHTALETHQSVETLRFISEQLHELVVRFKR